MEIEDDFIEDSEQSEEEEEDDLFLTRTRVDPPKEIVLKPAVNIYPISSLAQQLLSKMYSLQMFGQSSIGASVSGSVYELGNHLRNMLETFPSFIKESNISANSQQYLLQKKLANTKTKIQNLQQINKQLKEKVRYNEKQLPDLNRQNDTEFSELDRINSEIKANICSLKKAINRLQKIKEENDQIQSENQIIKNTIDDLLTQYRRSCPGEIGRINKNIVKTEIGLRENSKRYRENLEKAQEIISSYNEPIHSLETRLADMNRRISVFRRPVKAPIKSKCRK